jgi:hypothetical protein
MRPSLSRVYVSILLAAMSYSGAQGCSSTDDAFPELHAALESHYIETIALLGGIPHNSVESQALKSTFVAACSSPFLTSVGL